MRTIQVRLKENPYRIIVGTGILERVPSFLAKLGLAGRKVLIATERKAARHHLTRLTGALRRKGIRFQVYYFPRGERAKRPEEILRLHRFLLKQRFERKDPILALGGGAVGDAAGFAASTYLRGVPVIQIGTTLLAQVDSSIGGKTGINLAEGKNLVGTFYQPKLVVSDVTTLRTLPRRELVASLGEVIKYGVIRDAGLFRYLEGRIGLILAGDPKSLEEIVYRAAKIKAGVVAGDEKETKGERMILNYGHTFAHAFEASRNYRGLRHGEAVALGMICAARLARRRKLFSAKDELRQRQLIEKAGLPARLKPYGFSPERVLRPLLLDKKKSGGRVRFILPEAIGRVRVVDKIPLPQVKKVLEEA
jgi:3-dehydroquinate synthase